jgi:hypothetical protein
VKLQDLPCGECPYCTRAHSNWSGFEQDVDDVVPLANKPWGQPVCEGQDQEGEEIGPRVAGIWVSTGETGLENRGGCIFSFLLNAFEWRLRFKI